MIALIQRVTEAKVIINNKIISQINRGCLIFLGITETDQPNSAKKLADKIANLRIMADAKGKMNLTVQQTAGQLLVVSQFTLVADVTAGRRPSFIKAKSFDQAKLLYDLFIKLLKQKNLIVKTGQFGQYMQIHLINDGPVTIIIDTQNL